jgi:hypothetical protein
LFFVLLFLSLFFLCGCERAVYIGETYRRQFETRKKEHESKVRLTKQDIKIGKLESAEQRMGKEDGGLARHSVKCKGEIEWEKAEVVAMEKGLRQRKAREGIESLREQQSGREALNNFEQLTEWRTVLNSYFKQEMTKMRTTSRARKDHVG